MSETTPAGSIIERFRGTEWGTPEPPPPPPPPRRRGPLFLVGVFMVGIAAIVAVVVFGPGLTPDNRPGLRASFLPDDGITPRVPDSIRILDLYWALARDPALAYHLEGTGTSTAAGLDQSFELSLDVVGDDYGGTVNTIGGTDRVEMIRVDHVMYIRPEEAGWIVLRTDERILRQVPFMGIEGRRELEYEGTLTEDGRMLHRLVTNDFYAPSVERMLDLSNFTPKPAELSLDLIVDDQGVPVRASFSCVVRASVVDGIPGFEGTAEYRFGAFGEPAAISTPAP